MKEIKRLEEISTKLSVGANKVNIFIERLKKIVLNLKIQAAYINQTVQGKTIIMTSEELNLDLEILRENVRNIGFYSEKVGVEAKKIEYKNALMIVEKIDLISKQLWSESVKTFDFLEKLRITCLNLDIQIKYLGNTPETRAISAIIKILTEEINELQHQAMGVREGSKAIGQINRVIEEKYSVQKTNEEKPKVLTK